MAYWSFQPETMAIGGTQYATGFQQGPVRTHQDLSICRQGTQSQYQEPQNWRQEPPIRVQDPFRWSQKPAVGAQNHQSWPVEGIRVQEQLPNRFQDSHIRVRDPQFGYQETQFKPSEVRFGPYGAPIGDWASDRSPRQCCSCRSDYSSHLHQECYSRNQQELNNRYQVSNYGHDSGYGAPCYNIGNLPAYDGLTSFEEWLYRCEQFFYIHNIPEARKVELGGMNLFAVARHWHKQVMERCSRRFVWPTWDEYVYEMRLCSGMSNVLNHSYQVQMNVVVDEEGGDSLAPSWSYLDCGRNAAGYVAAQEPSRIVSQIELVSSPKKIDLEFENEAKLLNKEELDADVQAMDEGMELPQEMRVNVEVFCNLKAKEHGVPVECDAEFSVVNQKKMVSNGKSDELEVKNSDVLREVELVVHCGIKEVKMQDKNVGSSVDISAAVSNQFCKTIELNHLEMVAVLGRKCLEDPASYRMLAMGCVSIVQGAIQWDFKRYKKKLYARSDSSF